MSDNSVSSGIRCRSRVSTIDEGHGINLASQLSDNDVSPVFNNFYCRSRRCLWCARNMRVRCATKMRARGASSIKHCSAADSCWLASTVSTSNRGEKPAPTFISFVPTVQLLAALFRTPSNVLLSDVLVFSKLEEGAGIVRNELRAGR